MNPITAVCERITTVLLLSIPVLVLLVFCLYVASLRHSTPARSDATGYGDGEDTIAMASLEAGDRQ